MSRIISILLVGWLISLKLHAETLRGKVIHVADGDTITILDAQHQQFKIRLAGIDAPEKAQEFGQKSKAHLSSLVHEKQVEVQTSKKDKYGRYVGQVLVDSQDVNLSQLLAGWAWFYRQYEKELTMDLRKSYDQAEAQAKAGHLGLCRDANPMPPWEWRHQGQLGNQASRR